jgi:hypothetical protein
MLDLPRGLDWWREEPGGSDWLELLPQLVRECAEGWSLTLEQPFEDSHISLVMPARLPDGRPAALKLNFPRRRASTRQMPSSTTGARVRFSSSITTQTVARS